MKRSGHAMIGVVLGLFALAAAARAQVTIDQSVLDRLGPPSRAIAPRPGPGAAGLSLAPAPRVEAPSRATRRPARPPRRSQARRPARPPAVAATPAPAPALPQAPPPAPSLAAPGAPNLATPAPAPAPAPAPRAAPAPAALAAPPATTPAPLALPPATLRLAFAANESTLPPPSRLQLDAFARRAAPDDAGRIVVLGFGDDADGDVSRARRLALARAVEVRQVLVASGIRATRIDVRALGKPTDGSSPDRVDLALSAPTGPARP